MQTQYTDQDDIDLALGNLENAVRQHAREQKAREENDADGTLIYFPTADERESR